MEVSDEVKGFLEQLQERGEVDLEKETERLENIDKEPAEPQKEGEVKETQTQEHESKDAVTTVETKQEPQKDEYEETYKRHYEAIKNMSPEERMAYVQALVNKTVNIPQTQTQVQQQPQQTYPQGYQYPQQQTPTIPQTQTPQQTLQIPKVDERVLDDLGEIYPEVKDAFVKMKQTIVAYNKQLEEIKTRAMWQEEMTRRQNFIRQKDAEIENQIQSARMTEDGKPDELITDTDVDYVKMALQMEVANELAKIKRINPNVDDFYAVVDIINNFDIKKRAKYHFDKIRELKKQASEKLNGDEGSKKKVEIAPRTIEKRNKEEEDQNKMLSDEDVVAQMLSRR